MSDREPIQMEPGVYFDVTFADYVRIDAVNHSVLKTLEQQTASKAKYYMDHPGPETPALTLGRACHSLILEPETFADCWAVAPECDRRTKAGKQLYAAFMETAERKDVLSASDYVAIQEMAQAIEQQRLHKLVREGRAEVVIVWNDPDTGLLCKGRLDYLHETRGLFVIDFKTTENAGEEAFAYSIQKYNYHSQAAFYCMGLEELKGQTPGYTWLVAEKSPPYDVAAYQIQSATLEAGESFCRRALQKYARCLESDEWPGYPDQVIAIDMARWAIDRERQISQYMM